MQGTGHLDALSLFPVPARARIVFVDDDELVLRSIRRLIKGKEKHWDVQFFTDAHAALRELERESVDVIVSDVHMGPMGGGQLLAVVQEHHPDVARIVLSGETDPHVVFRTVPSCHQFLAKPFDSARLIQTLQRACALRGLLTNEKARALVGRSNDLPAAPATYTELTQALRDPRVSTSRIGSIIERDVGISARLLQIVSSSFFGTPRNATTITGAVGFLGLERVRTLVLACEVMRTFPGRAPLASFDIEAFEVHGLQTAKLARAMVPNDLGDDAFIGGLLHRVGHLLLASRVPQRLAEVAELRRREDLSVVEAEIQVLQVSHAEVGAYLLGLWGLRQQIVEAVAYYTRPERLGPMWNISGAIHLASILASNPDAEAGEEPSIKMNHVPIKYLERMGVAHELPRFRALAAQAKEAAAK
jgi:HD-like signal output (HDOD) protein/CheY-like chemotaxis protein